uniref:Uncharacterized protein n=1 Tax=Pipistrellus kuhlii TaxID=59472 RepID=A0A7J7VUX0_PIPKU|nr:hypothetical protein mPipKuh1_008323 [Pipistrellus kuhlii]
MDTSASRPEPTEDLAPEKKKNKPDGTLHGLGGHGGCKFQTCFILANISLMPISTNCGTCHHTVKSMAKYPAFSKVCSEVLFRGQHEYAKILNTWRKAVQLGVLVMNSSGSREDQEREADADSGDIIAYHKAHVC